MKSLIIFALVLAHGAPVDWSNDCHENTGDMTGPGWHCSHPKTETELIQKRCKEHADKLARTERRESNRYRIEAIRQNMSRIGCIG